MTTKKYSPSLTISQGQALPTCISPVISSSLLYRLETQQEAWLYPAWLGLWVDSDKETVERRGPRRQDGSLAL